MSAKTKFFISTLEKSKQKGASG